jgi:lambda repressor-like predicted transcriptional regulator
MNNDTDSTAEDGIGDIILRLWKEGKSLTEISEESGGPLETVRRVLKEIQKKIVWTKQD